MLAGPVALASFHQSLRKQLTEIAVRSTGSSGRKRSTNPVTNVGIMVESAPQFRFGSGKNPYTETIEGDWSVG
jgi:hypothetical protein